MGRTIEVVSKTEIKKIVNEAIEKKTIYLENLLTRLRGRIIDIEKILEKSR